MKGLTSLSNIVKYRADKREEEKMINRIKGNEASSTQVVPEDVSPVSDFSNTDSGGGALSYSAKFRKKRNKLKNKL